METSGIGTTSPQTQTHHIKEPPQPIAHHSEVNLLLQTVGQWELGGQKADETFAHTTGNTGTLTHSASITNGYKYQVSWTITGQTAGSVTITVVGQSSGTQTGSSSWGLIATSSTSFTITPQDFDGVLSAISLKRITGTSSPSHLERLQWNDRFEARTGNTTNNIFLGLDSGKYNTTGIDNVANGVNALSSNMSGSDNTRQWNECSQN